MVAIIGVLSALALPYFSDLQSGVSKEKNRRNAQQIVALSTAVSGLGIAHVLPDSLGGVEATARLLREGVTVIEGPASGEHIALAGLSDEEITGAADYLEIVYLPNKLSLRYNPGAVP